jgi:hypothetical protein
LFQLDINVTEIAVTVSFVFFKKCGKGQACGFEYSSGIKITAAPLLGKLLIAQLITPK